MTGPPSASGDATGILTKILHRAVAKPWVYDWVQFMAGARYTRRRLAAQIAQLHPASLVLDVAGGTGMFRDLWPSTCTYICLDNDMLKLRGFLNRNPNGVPLLADVTQAPIRSDVADVVLCVAAFHHIPEEFLVNFISESMRLVKNTGKFIFLDAIWKPTRWTGRLLWKYDRGSYPRRPETLYSLISGHAEIIHWEHFAIFHECILGVAIKKPR